MNSMVPYNFPLQVAWKTLNLLIERKALLYPTGTAFYVWQRGQRIIVAFDPSAIDTERVNEDFSHRLSTRLHGRRVVRTNSRGLFLQVGFDIPAAPMSLDAKPLDLTQQGSAWDVPMGPTKEGPLWIPFIDGDSYLIGGSRGGGKGGLEHAWIQALLHGGKTLVYAWDGKNGAEFGRYADQPNFRFMTGASMNELQVILKERERQLTQSGYPNVIMHNEAGQDFMMPIALFVDEAADLPDAAKPALAQIIRLFRHVGLHPVICTNQPTVAELFAKTNLKTRIAFRVPTIDNSRVILDYKGAEALPDTRGRGLIIWKGKFVEFQTFTVNYPMPSEEAKRLMSEQAAAKEEPPIISEVQQLAESIRTQWKPEMSKRAVSRLLGKEYAGNSWTSKVDQIIEWLRATTTPSTPVLGLDGASG